MKYWHLNLIRKTLALPFHVVFRTLCFVFFPLTLICGFIMTDWESEWDRNFFWKQIKNDISFGFWKHKK